ncbi:unnamed protein product [Urochloa decumbens]|uniref:Uncharacterized protein n=1 Tax=Urochloa decumbens TaxID=240449 RepID=A0ABC8X054_9POAL
MDLRQQESRRQSDKSSIAPPYKGPRRITFRIRRRWFTFEGCPSLLISDRYGVWSVTHRRYIHKTRRLRFHDLKKELDPIRIQVRKHKMNRWPQYSQDEELRSLRRKLADLYWGVMPEQAKARTVRLYRGRREQRRAKELRRFAAAVVCFAVAGFVLLRLVLMGCYSVPVSLFLGSGYIFSAYLLDKSWHL